jgi:hypothetical protein
MKNYIILSLVFVWLSLSCQPKPVAPTVADDLKAVAGKSAKGLGAKKNGSGNNSQSGCNPKSHTDAANTLQSGTPNLGVTGLAGQKNISLFAIQSEIGEIAYNEYYMLTNFSKLNTDTKYEDYKEYIICETGTTIGQYIRKTDANPNLHSNCASALLGANGFPTQGCTCGRSRRDKFAVRPPLGESGKSRVLIYLRRCIDKSRSTENYFCGAWGSTFSDIKSVDQHQGLDNNLESMLVKKVEFEAEMDILAESALTYRSSFISKYVKQDGSYNSRYTSLSQEERAMLDSLYKQTQTWGLYPSNFSDYLLTGIGETDLTIETYIAETIVQDNLSQTGTNLSLAQNMLLASEDCPDSNRKSSKDFAVDTAGSDGFSIDDSALAQVNLPEIGAMFSVSLGDPNDVSSGGLTGGFTEDTSGCIDDPNSEDPNAEGGQRCSSQDSSSSLAGTGKKIGIGIAVLAGLYLVKTIAGLPSLKKTFTLGSGRIRIQGREFNFDGPGKWAFIGRVLQGIGTTLSNIILKLLPIPTPWQFAARNGVNKLNKTIDADFNTDSKGAFLDLAALDKAAGEGRITELKAASIGCSGGKCSEVELKCTGCNTTDQSKLFGKGIEVEGDGVVKFKRTQFIDNFKLSLADPKSNASGLLDGMIDERANFIKDTFLKHAETGKFAGGSGTEFLDSFNKAAATAAGGDNKWKNMTSGERKDFMDRKRGAILESMKEGKTNFQNLNGDGQARFTQAAMFSASQIELESIQGLAHANALDVARISVLEGIQADTTKIAEYKAAINQRKEELDGLDDGDTKITKQAELEDVQKQKTELVEKNNAAIEARKTAITAEIAGVAADVEAKASLEAERVALEEAKTIEGKAGDTDALGKVIAGKTESLKSGGGDLDARLRQAGVFSSDFVAPKAGFGSTRTTWDVGLRTAPDGGFKNIMSFKGVGALGALGAGIGMLFAGLSGGDAEVFQVALVRGTPKIERLLAELKALEVERVELRLAYLNQNIKYKINSP